MKLKAGDTVMLMDGVTLRGKPVTRAQVVSANPLALMFLVDGKQEIQLAKKSMIMMVLK